MVNSSTSIAVRQAPRIVDDLIPVILESDDHWWPRDLRRLAVVSSSWLGPVRCRLFSHPVISTVRACHLLVRTLAENPTLLPLVRSVDLCPVADVYSGCCGATEREIANVRFILALEGLRSVKLGGALSIVAERFIQPAAIPRTITKFSVDGSAVNAPCPFNGASLLWDETLAAKFISLHTLKLSSIELTVLPSLTPYSMQLTELYLENVDIIATTLTDLFQESWCALRTLSVCAKSAAGYDDHVRSMIQRCVNLEILRYEVRDTHGHGCIFDHESPSRPSLHQLTLSGLDITLQTLHDISQCCDHLEHLTVLGHLVRISSTDWASWLASDALPLLRVLKTPRCTTSPPFVYWSDDMIQQVQDACSVRNVCFTC